MKWVRRAAWSALVVSCVCLLTVMLLFAPIAGCRRPVEHEAEKRIAELLPRYLGPADKYTVNVTGDSPGAILRGRLRKVHVEGKRVQLTPGMIVDNLTLDFDEVAVDPKAGKLQNIGRAAFTGRISDISLTRYLRQSRTDIPDLTIAFEGNHVEVSGKPRVLHFVDVPVTVRGMIVPRGKSRLEFVPDRAQVSAVPIPGLALDWLTAHLNPTLDISLAKAPLRVELVQIKDHALYLSGTVAPDDLLQLANP